MGFLGWPYYVGVLVSFFQSMILLINISYKLQMTALLLIFATIAFFIILLFFETTHGKISKGKLFFGLFFGFADDGRNSLFTVVTILGAMCKPHNLHLYMVHCLAR